MCNKNLIIFNKKLFNEIIGEILKKKYFSIGNEIY